MSEVHVEIPPFRAYVHEKFLYDMDESKKGLIKCDVFGISSYPGHMLTFTIYICETGGVFCYIPLHALVANQESGGNSMPLKDHQLMNCPDKEIAVTSYEFLKEKKVTCFLSRDKSYITSGDYLFSVDWYNLNELLNVIRLSNGLFAALPPYRILFGGAEPKKQLPDYKALHPEFKV